MRLGARGRGELGHFSCLGIEPADDVAPLADPPDASVRPLDGIAGALAERRDRPLLEADRELSIDLLPGPVAVLGKMLREPVEQRIAGLGIAGQVDHGGGEPFPPRPVVADRAPHVGRAVAGGAVGFERLAPRTWGKFLGFRRAAREDGRSDEQGGKCVTHDVAPDASCANA